MLQDVPPVLTRWTPDWLPWLLGGAYLAYRSVKSLRETFRKGKDTQRKEREGEIATAIAPLKEQLKEARELADLRREKIEELDKTVRARDERIASLETRLSQGKETVDDLQQTVYELRGEIAEMGRRLKRYEDEGEQHQTGA